MGLDDAVDIRDSGFTSQSQSQYDSGLIASLVFSASPFLFKLFFFHFGNHRDVLYSTVNGAAIRCCLAECQHATLVRKPAPQQHPHPHPRTRKPISNSALVRGGATKTMKSHSTCPGGALHTPSYLMRCCRRRRRRRQRPKYARISRSKKRENNMSHMHMHHTTVP